MIGCVIQIVVGAHVVHRQRGGRAARRRASRNTAHRRQRRRVGARTAGTRCVLRLSAASNDVKLLYTYAMLSHA